MLDPYVRDPVALRDEIRAFEQLLGSGSALREKDDLLPFFRGHTHLAAALGYANNNIASPDLVRVEYELFDFRCDVAIGESASGQFTLVELESATPESIFRTRPSGRTHPYWSTRYESGFSQLVDWAWRIGIEQPPSLNLKPLFGTTAPKIHYLLLIGQDRWLDEAGRARLEWRRVNNGIQGQSTTVWTYDYFLGYLQRRFAAAYQGLP